MRQRDALPSPDTTSDPLDRVDRASTPPAIGIAHTRTRDLAVLAFVCFVTMFTGLGNTALWEPDEPRFAEATRQMFARHDFLTPWFNDAPRFEKPILMYWMQTPFVAVLGATETAFRLPSAIAGLFTVLLVYSLGAHLVSRRAGLIAGVCLATTLRFVLYARQGLTDVPVTAFVTLTLWGFVRALDSPVERSRRYALLGWAGVAAGALTKGPVAILGPIVAIVFMLLTDRASQWRRLHVASGMLLASAIVLPWFVFMIAAHGRAFLQVALGYEVVARYLSSDFPGRERGFLFFFTTWLGDGAPWSIACAGAFVWVAWRWRTLEGRVRRAVGFALIWFFTVLLVFSVSHYKLPHYIMPAYPGMTLLVGIFADERLGRRVAPAALWAVPMRLAGGALVALAGLVWLLLRRVFGLPVADPAFLLSLALAAGGMAVLAIQLSGRDARALLALVATLVFSYGYLALEIAPRELRRFQPVPALARVVKAVSAPGDPVAVAGNYGVPGLVFYAGRPVVQLLGREQLIQFLSSPGPRTCVLPRADYDAVRDSIPRAYTIAGQAGVFSVRLRRLLEREPGRASRTLLVVTASGRSRQ